jgi:nitroreductase
MSSVDMIGLDPPAELDMGLGEAMFTQRAIRRLDPDRPVTDDQLRLVLDAASKAPNGANAQVARFLVIRDRAVIEAFGRLYHEAWWAKRADELGWEPDQEVPADSPYKMAAVLASEMHAAPVVVMAFSVRLGAAAAGSVFPAVQNLMLAARALGLGSVLTTLHPSVMARVHALLGVPDDVHFHACIPLGYPRGAFGPTRRLPTADTTSWDTWGARPPWG